MSDDDFDWFGDEAIAVRHQPALAVYINAYGNITIRQRGELDPRTLDYDDTVVTVTPRNAAELARAILALAEPMPGPTLALPAPPPSDPTAAERQRRHRARKRSGVTAGIVTGEGVTRDGHYGRNGSVTRNGSDLFPD